MWGKRTALLVRPFLLLIISAVIVFAALSMNRFWENKSQAQPEKVREAIERACVQCYALEGSYPPDLDYLKDHYGIILDHERFYYYYEAFASNLMPVVEVYEKEP